MNQSQKSFATQIQELSVNEVGITGSPSTTLMINIDITERSKTSRALGQMVHVFVKEDEKDILAVGQIVELKTRNRWHEDMAFKGVIKRHGSLPNLSGVADNRLATISVQSCFDVSKNPPIAHILGVSPSTGESVNRMDNKVMSELVAHQEDMITRIGRVYGTDVDMPMWFKHFGDGDDGAGDTHHIGVFGKTGSGKTTTASMMLLGYALSGQMNILVLDPKRQFSLDTELLPSRKKFKEQIENIGMKYSALDLVQDVFLPANPRLLADLVLTNGFIRLAFGLTTEDKQNALSDRIEAYFSGRCRNPRFKLHEQNAREMLQYMLLNFNKKEGKEEISEDIKYVYSRGNLQKRLKATIDARLSDLREPGDLDFLHKWEDAFALFAQQKSGGKDKMSMDDMVDKIVSSQGGELIVLALGRDSHTRENENLQALFLQQIERKIAEKGEAMYAESERANCLIVMDEAHRFVAEKSPDERVRELTREIVDAVRTTRKYGIGHMFITQTLESMNDEILKQMRVFAFGHGLTTGAELRKVKEVVNSEESVSLYKSFIDPTGVRQFPFMFFGPVSPFSATGSPLFVEIYTEFADFETMNKHRLANESR